MHTLFVRSVTAIATLTIAGSAVAGTGMSWLPASVPVDSPWAIAGLGAVVAVVAARLLANRRK
jgi:hypothetical protein